jgi:SAM-dependent methyltransferase
MTHLRHSIELKEFYEKEASYYSFYSPFKKYLLFKPIASLIPDETEMVLDIGCGGGHFLRELQSNGDLIGLDISKNLTYFGKRLVNKATFIIGDAQHLPIRNDSISIAVSIEVLEHVKVPLLAIEEINRILRPGGIGIIVVPHERNWFRLRISLGQFLEAFKERGHLTKFDEQKVRQVFRNFVTKIYSLRLNPSTLCKIYNNVDVENIKKNQLRLMLKLIATLCTYNPLLFTLFNFLSKRFPLFFAIIMRK